MAIAVSAWFDSPTEDSVRGIWSQLASRGISSLLHDGPYRPHVTLGIYEELHVPEFSKALREAVIDVEPFECQMPLIGLFPNKPVVGFLGVTQTAGLNHLHQNVHQLMARFGTSPRPYYLPDNWNPHCSLAPDLSSESLGDFLQVAKELKLPLKASINRIGIIDTPAEMELESIKLGGK